MPQRASKSRPTEDSTGSAADFIPPRPTLSRLRAASKGCRGCHLWKVGTQTVFGEGPPGAEVLIVGEQPGDQEDLAGKPFVGPSGKLLDAALADAGIDRTKVYVTNAVKHFKWERGPGKRRIHKKPNDTEIRACHPWLRAELAVLDPRVVVCLGATAAQSLLGKAFRVTQTRGKVLRPWGDKPLVVATVHPSSILRAPAADRAANEKAFMRDIRKIAKYV
jgi:uracil-DNA glycosylase family protein